MNKFIKVILVTLLVVITLKANKIDDIVISENFLKHPYCDDIKRVSLKTKQGSKTTLFEMLKKKAKNLGGNAVINTNYEVGYFGTKTVEGIISKCNVKNSPELFVKSSETISVTTQDIKESNFDIKPQDIFGMIILLSDSIDMDKVNGAVSGSETKSSLGIGIKTGVVKDDFRYYANLSIATGNLMLASVDYIYNIDQETKIYLGVSFGIAQYELSDSSSINALSKGFQISLQNKEYEFGYQLLSANKSTSVNSTNYTLKDISFLYVGYHF